MPRKTDALVVHDVMELAGYSSQQILWVMEFLQGRVDQSKIRCNPCPMNRTSNTITEKQITEAAAHAASEDLARLESGRKSAMVFDDEDLT